ncbi:phage terminase small subunit P27 family [Corticicoccus populi]|uniref:Phage terminase small subunit P27 family n=1 Tax=Corticicoccus populi TaxID=1812821 RepID=A0ABW5WV24_9STAP
MGKDRLLVDNVKGNLTQDEIDARKSAEKRMYDLEPIDITPPEHLDDIAQTEYKRIVPLLRELPIAALDYSMVCAYCQFYSNWLQASEQMKSESLTITTAHGVRSNPLIIIQRDAHRSMQSIASKLGMTIDSRLKIMTPKQSEQKSDPFKSFFE